MTDLFLDIETVPNFSSSDEFFQVKEKVESGLLNEKSDENFLYWKYQGGALNPFDGKVILLTYKIDDGHTFRLNEWQLGEEKLLKEFYDLVCDLEYRSTTKEHLKIIGQNIRGFDLIFLYERMKQFQRENERWLYRRLIKKPEIIDFIQMHLPLNNFQIKGLNHDVLVHAYGFQTKVSPTSEIASNYYGKKFDKIIEYSNSKFIYPELYKKILVEGLVSPESLQESIRFVNSKTKM